jgi:hypothetical protein
VLLAFNKQAVLAGHFFKEDPLFALGLSLTLLAGACRWRNRSSWVSLIALGAAAGLATAAKYLGVVTLIYAVVLELAISRTAFGTNASITPTSRVVPDFARRVFILLLAALAAMFLFSVSSGWNHFPALMRAVVEGSQTARVGNDGIGAKIPHARYLGMFFLEPPFALIGLAFLGWSFVRNARPIAVYADRWLLFSAPFFLAIVFSFSAITAVRYFLPISLLIACLGGFGLAVGTQKVGDWVRQHWRVRPSVTTCAAVGLCAMGQLPPVILLECGFSIDDRNVLRSYIARQLPPNAIIAADHLACLDAPPRLPQRILTRLTIADLGDLATLRAQGVTHVVVCWYDSRRYITPGKQPATAAKSDFLRRREFYMSLKNQARLRWHSEIAQPFPLRPGLSLYELSPVAEASP